MVKLTGDILGIVNVNDVGLFVWVNLGIIELHCVQKGIAPFGPDRTCKIIFCKKDRKCIALFLQVLYKFKNRVSVIGTHKLEIIVIYGTVTKNDGKSGAGLLYKQRVLAGTGVYDQTVYMPAHQGSDIGLFFFDTIVTADK